VFKPVSPQSKATVVSSHDPAVDWSAIVAREIEEHPKLKDEETARMAFELRFVQDAMWGDPANAQKLLIFNGDHPTRFVVGVVPPTELIRIQDDCKDKDGKFREHELQWRCFLHGLRDIEGWEDEVPKHNVAGVEYVKPSWLQRTFLMELRNVALQIGAMVWTFNNMTRGEVKN
jgi:hypothetical protein